MKQFLILILLLVFATFLMIFYLKSEIKSSVNLPSNSKTPVSKPGATEYPKGIVLVATSTTIVPTSSPKIPAPTNTSVVLPGFTGPSGEPHINGPSGPPPG